MIAAAALTQSPGAKVIDCIYVAASRHDARLTRTCVASIRRFYPDAPIRLLAGGPLQPGLAEELHRWWGVERADFPAGDYGWGFVKLEPLFGPAGQRFMVLDSDTAFTGRVLDACADADAPFVVDEEQQAETDGKRLYYDWDRLAEIDPQIRPPQFLFNSGQWFGTAGVLTREDFAPWIEWSMPPRLRHPEHFMGGDQGVLNYVLNKKASLEGLRVERRKIMRWPGHGMDGLDAGTVARGDAPALVVHWAGVKKAWFRDMAGGDLLQLFETLYYSKAANGRLRRVVALWRHVWTRWSHGLRQRLTLRLRKAFGSR